MQEINLNSDIKFKLTDHGKQILNKHVASIDFGESNLDYLREVIQEKNTADSDGYHKMQMWYAMSVFGKGMYSGAKNIFESNVILIEVAK